MRRFRSAHPRRMPVSEKVGADLRFHLVQGSATRAVVPIRGLMLSKEQRKLLYAFECHANLIRNYELDLLNKNVANLPDEEQMEFMRRICSVLNTNSFGYGRIFTGQGLDYSLGAFQNHCCVPNTRHHFDDQ